VNLEAILEPKKNLFLFSIVLILCFSACTAELADESSPVTTINLTGDSAESEAVLTVAPTHQTAETAVSTSPLTPSPTGIFINDEPIVFEKFDTVESLAINLEAATGLMAYQQDRQLWINQIDGSDMPMQVTACDESDIYDYCLPQLHWSPDGTSFFYETAVNHSYRLIISDLQGNQQGFSVSTRPYRTPVWSPDGRRLILFVGTKQPWGDHFNQDLSPDDYGFLDEVWLLQMDDAGTWSTPQKLTQLETPGIGCGGGGGSVSDRLYELQDGFPSGFQAAKKMFWTSDDVIIYHLSCDYYLSQGYGRYDVKSNQPLEPYSGKLHGLVLDGSGSRWYAMTGREHDQDESMANRLVTGMVDEAVYEVVETAVPVEMVFVGQHSGRLYYTAREQTDCKDLTGEVQGNLLSPPYFHFYHSQLWTIQPDGSDERLLWESDDHSYSRVTETPDGDLLFVLIENDVARFEAMSNGLPEVEWLGYFPHTHIMRLSANNPEPEIFMEDARDLTVWYPLSQQ
jgi:hypothetical protein